MGYFITDYKEEDDSSTFFSTILLATDEEARVAELALHSECGISLTEVEKNMPRDLGSIIYKNMLTIYIREIQNMMNTARCNLFGQGYRPSEAEEAVRVILNRISILDEVEDYKKGRLPNQLYSFYEMNDDEVYDWRKKEKVDPQKPTEEGLIPVGTDAFHLIDYEKIVPVTVTGRTGFIFYCESDNGHRYIVPYHQLFRTQKEAQTRLDKRNRRRDRAIEKYHLLDISDDKQLNKDRRLALEWLHYNRNPPKLLVKRLKDALQSF